MKKILYFFLLLPFFLQAQNDYIPHVRFDQGSILFYIPSQSAYAPLLPAYKPGFVHILRTMEFQTQSNLELSDHLSSGIRDLVSQSMTSEQQTEFLEKYACLILLNYANVFELDTLFYSKAMELRKDANEEIRANAKLVMKTVDLYRKK